MDVPRDLDLGNRARALEQLKVHPAAHSQMVSMVRDILPEQEAGLLVGSRQWPLLAARMHKIGESEGTHVVAQHLNRLTADTSWKRATGTALVGRPRGRDPPLPDHAALRVARVRVPAVGLPDGGPLPLHHHPHRSPRTAGPGRSRRPRPPTADRAHQGSRARTVDARCCARGQGRGNGGLPGGREAWPFRGYGRCRHGYDPDGTRPPERKGEAAVNPRQFYGGIALGLALSVAGWAVHHYTGPWAGLRGPTRPSGERPTRALPGPRVPESDEVRSYAARISEGSEPQD